MRKFKSKSKSIATLVQNFGLSTRAIEIITEVAPPGKPLADIVRQVAHFLLASESREESRWQATGVPELENYLGKKILIKHSKAVTFHIPGGSYTPDYWYILEDGRDVLVETKGSPYQSGYEAAMLRLRACATLYWHIVWVKTMYQEGKWVIETIPPDNDYEGRLRALADEIDKEAS